ncbi:PLP-dependent aminotransferase family protein [Desulfospira joergensenii]|uniref:aminotransferase-like domain-containing protein n=1 Tax=Desulfospira joergensenii TaxID=53329 RepID=UPI0003B42736|nr:PLP-dependent aminotransferase family protein [Desulfospira joergensenii]
MKSTPNFRYVTLADQIQDNITQGLFRPGDKLPSLRRLHTRLGLSVSTVHHAYIELEKRGRVEAREKSGFYVRPLDRSPLAVPRQVHAEARPSRVHINDLLRTIIAELADEDILQLGTAVCSRELMPLKQLTRIMKSIPGDSLGTFLSNYEDCAGNISLRQAVSQQMLGHACSITPEEVVTTNGCLDAVSLCLRAVAEPGDTILVESPVFHCFLQLIEDLNLYVLELPCCPEEGINLKNLEKALDANQVKACILNSNFQNPLGYAVSKEKKAAILEITQSRGLPVIEDDIYGDLYFSGSRPPTFKSMDREGMVLYCSSFSKTLAPGLRTGWTLPGRFLKKVLRMKSSTTISNAGINQAVAAEFISTGAYDRHLRKLRNQIKNQASALAMALSKHFPRDTRITFPTGGMCIWVVLNKKIDSMDIYHRAHAKKISILPGKICSSSDRYNHCLRLNCGIKRGPRMEQGIMALGKIIRQEYRDLDIPV